jgi:hypothetical protein
MARKRPQIAPTGAMGRTLADLKEGLNRGFGELAGVVEDIFQRLEAAEQLRPGISNHSGETTKPQPLYTTSDYPVQDTQKGDNNMAKQRAGQGAQGGAGAQAGGNQPAGAQQGDNLNPLNTKLHGIHSNYGLNDLVTAMADAYISAAKYTDANGVERYHAYTSEEDKEMIGEKVADAMVYHLLRRHYQGVDQAFGQQLMNVQDPNGLKLMDPVLRSWFDTDMAGVKSLFKRQERVDLSTVFSYANQVEERYEGLIITETLRSGLKDQLKHQPTLAANMRDLNRLGLVGKAQADRWNSMDADSLLNVYAQMAKMSWNV